MPSKKSAFSVGEDEPPTAETRLEHPILGLEVFDECILLPGEPRSQHDDQKLRQRGRLNHAASLPYRTPSCSVDLDRIFGHHGREENRRVDARKCLIWRRGRDSNPRRAYTLNRFRVCRNRPLCHLSAAARILSPPLAPA